MIEEVPLSLMASAKADGSPTAHARVVYAPGRRIRSGRFSTETSAADHLHSIASGGRPRHVRTKSTSWPALSRQYAPVVEGLALEGGEWFVQDKVLPEETEIVGPERRPAPMVADEAGIEPVDLRRRHDLRRPARAEWPDHVGQTDGRRPVDQREGDGHRPAVQSDALSIRNV